MTEMRCNTFIILQLDTCLSPTYYAFTIILSSYQVKHTSLILQATFTVALHDSKQQAMNHITSKAKTTWLLHAYNP